MSTTMTAPTTALSQAASNLKNPVFAEPGKLLGMVLCLHEVLVALRHEIFKHDCFDLLKQTRDRQTRASKLKRKLEAGRSKFPKLPPTLVLPFSSYSGGFAWMAPERKRRW